MCNSRGVERENADNVMLYIMDQTGHRVESLNIVALPSGTHELEWDGSAYGPGLYIGQIYAN